jgi:hypothetical protein
VTSAGSKITSTTSPAWLEMAARQSIMPAIVVLLLGVVITWGGDGCGTDKRLTTGVTPRYIEPYPFPG